MEAVRERENFDKGLLVVTIFLLLIGTVVVLDASYARALHSKFTGNDAYFYFKRQALWAAVSLAVLLVSMHYPYWKLRRFWFVGLVVALVLLVAVMVPGIGREVNGSRRWLGVGPAAFQPSEFAKIALVLFLARFSDVWRSRICHFWKGFVPAVLAVGAVGGLVAKEDLGTAITIVCTGLVMIFMMGSRPKHMLGLMGVALAGGVVLVMSEHYRLLRVQAWLDLVFRPLQIHDGPAYQPFQGLLALGSGGIWGLGIMQGKAKHLYLPAEHTDYIFATIGEETGLWGCLLLLSLFAWLAIRGLTVAHRTRDWFGSLTAAGLTAIIAIQAILNIAVVTCLVPCTGVPLPFISYGGSSLVFTTLAVGIVLNISQFPNRAAAELQGRQPRESRADGWRHRRPHLSGT